MADKLKDEPAVRLLLDRATPIGGTRDPLERSVNEATGGAPASPRQPYTYYSPEGKRARHEGLLDAVRKRNDARERLDNVYQETRKSQATDLVPNYAKGGSVKHGSPTGVVCSSNKIVR